MAHRARGAHGAGLGPATHPALTIGVLPDDLRPVSAAILDQDSSGGSAVPAPLAVSADGEIRLSQQIGHATCGRVCRPFSCSAAK
jgi:hypothetical protein